MSTSPFTVVARGEFAVAELAPQPPCDRCDGHGRREAVYDGVPRVVRCRCQMLPDRAALFNAARIPARHAHCSFAPPSPMQAPFVYGWAREYRPGEDNRGLLLWGPPGRGKTHLAVAALRHLILEKGVPGRFVEFSHLVSAIREGIGRGDPEATTLTPFITPEVLLVDELGKGRKTEWEQGILDEIVSRRYNARRVILATTNFPFGRGDVDPARRPGPGAPTATGWAPVESLEERVGERIFSRFRGSLTPLQVEGEDYRTTARARVGGNVV
jgi:DNA replication protein DnaC